jgi:hypothetical protein
MSDELEAELHTRVPIPFQVEAEAYERQRITMINGRFKNWPPTTPRPFLVQLHGGFLDGKIIPMPFIDAGFSATQEDGTVTHWEPREEGSREYRVKKDD